VPRNRHVAYGKCESYGGIAFVSQREGPHPSLGSVRPRIGANPADCGLSPWLVHDFNLTRSQASKSSPDGLCDGLLGGPACRQPLGAPIAVRLLRFREPSPNERSTPLGCQGEPKSR